MRVPRPTPGSSLGTCHGTTQLDGDPSDAGDHSNTDVCLIPTRRFPMWPIMAVFAMAILVPLQVVSAQTGQDETAQAGQGETAQSSQSGPDETAQAGQGETAPVQAGIDAEFLTRQLESDVELAVNRSEASRLREEGTEVSRKLAAMRGDVTLLTNRIEELEFAMENQALLIERARESRRDMAEQRSEILAELSLLDMEADTLRHLLQQRAIAAYMNPTSDMEVSVLTAPSALEAESSRVLVQTVLDQEDDVLEALHQRSWAMEQNEQILAALAEHANRTHEAETRAQESLGRDQEEYASLKALLGDEISRSESEYQELSTLADQIDAEIAERESQLHAIAVRRAERRARCEASGGQVADDGDEIDCSYLGAQLAPGSLAPPLFSSVSSGFGMRRHPIDGVDRMHEGWDYDANSGTAIGAAGPGEVFFVGWISGFGKTVIIDHGGGVETLYAHQSETLVAEGTVVATGQTIGLVGSTGKSTGPHLHFEVSKDGKAVDPAGFISL